MEGMAVECLVAYWYGMFAVGIEGEKEKMSEPSDEGMELIEEEPEDGIRCWLSKEENCMWQLGLSLVLEKIGQR